MSAEITIPHVFDLPVIWEDEQGSTSVVKLDGYFIAERTLEGCMFHCELQEDGQSVKVSINDDVEDYLASIYSSFEDWTERVIDMLCDDDAQLVVILDAQTKQPYFVSNNQEKTKPLPVSIACSSLSDILPKPF